MKPPLIQFDLIGTGGPGLLPTSEPSIVVGGTGGEILGGITYDDVTRPMFVNVGWGSANGFTDLGSASNMSHIHGPTAAANGSNGVNNFVQTAGILFNLTRTSNATTGGQILASGNPITLTLTQQSELYSGRYYINLRTLNNGGGEMRGFLVVVPEPTAGLLGLASLGVLTLRRRRA